MARRKNIWHPSYPVTITGASEWRESQSNPGAFYREIYVQCDGKPIGRQFVDESMDNYQVKGWDIILAALDEGYEIQGDGCVCVNPEGDMMLDCDHFTATRVLEPHRA